MGKTKPLKRLGAVGYWTAPNGWITVVWDKKPSWWEKFVETVIYGYTWTEYK